MVDVALMHPSPSTLGHWELAAGAAIVSVGGVDTVDEYVEYILSLGTLTQDDATRTWASAADGRTCGQDGGTIVGWRSADDSVFLECVWDRASRPSK